MHELAKSLHPLTVVEHRNDLTRESQLIISRKCNDQNLDVPGLNL